MHDMLEPASGAPRDAATVVLLRDGQEVARVVRPTAVQDLLTALAGA